MMNVDETIHLSDEHSHSVQFEVFDFQPDEGFLTSVDHVAKMDNPSATLILNKAEAVQLGTALLEWGNSHE